MTLKSSLLQPVMAALFLTAVLSACEKVDSHRLPPANVNLTFNTVGDWNIYGVSGAGQPKEFIKSKRIPADYPYKISEYTGFGGILLVADPYGEYHAYDLACPVEKKPDITVAFDTENPTAGIVRCAECGSTYDLYSQGTPVSGEALKLKYGLERYQVFVGSPTPPYAVVRR